MKNTNPNAMNEFQNYAEKLAQSLDWLDNESNEILKSIMSRDELLKKDKDFFFRELRSRREEIRKLKNEIRAMNTEIHLITATFRKILKKDQFEPFKQVVDDIKYEEYLTREELAKQYNIKE